jgi:hypothetical protein
VAEQRIVALESRIGFLQQEKDSLIEIIQRFEEREKQWDQRWQSLLGQLDQMKQRELQWEQREKQWEQREKQWEQREKQWESEHAQLSSQVAKLEDAVKTAGMNLKTALGIEPSSERGGPLTRATSPDGGGSGGNSDDPPTEPEQPPSRHEQKYLNVFSRHRPPSPVGLKESASVQEWWLGLESDPRCIPAPATIFGSRLFGLREEDRDFSFTLEERQQLFGQQVGLASKKRESTVYGLDVSVVKIQCIQEKIADFSREHWFHKSHSLGPKGSQISWEALAKIVTLVAEYAFPMNRLSKTFGHEYFSSANISRWFARSALPLLPVYIALGKALAKVDYLRTDDTSALVLDLKAEAKKGGLVADKQMSKEAWDKYLKDLGESTDTDLISDVIKVFGRVSQTVDGKAAKVSINTTLVSGRLDHTDYNSTVYFYRTHFGQAGNLLSRILKHRPENSGPLIIQGDSSPQNHVEEAIADILELIYIGCLSHCRRPFYRYRNRDKQLSFCMLRCFSVLAHIEALIKRGPLTTQRILHYRQRYGTKVWTLMKAVAQAVLDGERHPWADNQIWKKDDKLYEACAYLIRHYDELTFYLGHAQACADNNLSEQGLRGEKLIESAAYFRKSENGRTALDIHRTLLASCNAGNLSYAVYIKFVSEADPVEVKNHPEQYFGFDSTAGQKSPLDHH